MSCSQALARISASEGQRSLAMTPRTKSNPRTPPPMLGSLLHVAVVSVAILMVSAFCAAQDVTALHIFSGGADGSNPAAPVVANHNGVLYGTTWYGGLS